jgi:hypothetical protein
MEDGNGPESRDPSSARTHDWDARAREEVGVSKTMPETIADRPTVKRQGLFPCEAEIARRLSQSEKRWRQIVRQLEREGLPKIDPVMGGRFWPAVVAFFGARYGVDAAATVGNVMACPGPPDGEEHWDAV